jgi:von Willebrand factor type A domain
VLFADPAWTCSFWPFSVSATLNSTTLNPTTLNSTSKLASRPWRYAVTASAGLHALILIGAALCVVEYRTSHGSNDTLEAGTLAGDAGDMATVAPARLIDVAPATGAVSKTSSDAAGVGAAQNLPNGPSVVAGLEGRSSQIRLAANAQPLGSAWLSDSRSRGGLADVVGATIGQRGSPTDGDASGGAGGGGHKASFFGLGAQGQRIVFVVDASASMNHPYLGEGRTRIGQMKLELAKSILSLTEEQRFFIIFFNEHAIPMPATGMEPADAQNQQRFLSWVASVPAAGLTDPRPALSMALSLRPDVVYLLTDGTFPRDVQGDLNGLRQTATELNTIAIGDPKAEKSLKALAVRNGGHFTFVP